MSIHINSLNKSYTKKGRLILKDVNLEIPDHAFVMLRGVSGSGKSTLLNIIGGIEPATSGTVTIDGKNIDDLKPKERSDFYRHEIGFIFQGFYLQPQLTIGENIALMGVFAGMPKTERQARVQKLAEDLGIAAVLDQKPAEVSGGQAERACVARAMFMNPKIILADEPTNNLDPDNAKNVIELLKKIWQDTGTTVIVASHDPMVEQYATQIIGIKEGVVTKSEKPTQLVSNQSEAKSETTTNPAAQPNSEEQA